MPTIQGYCFALAAKYEFLVQRLKREGLAWMVGRIAVKMATAACWLVLIPFSLTVHLLGFRRLTVYADRIGHLAVEVDCFVKERQLGKLPPKRWFMLAPAEDVANAHLLSYWRPYITVLQDPLGCALLDVMSRWWFIKHDASRYTNRQFQTAEMYSINAAWNGREPVLRLREEDERWGDERILELGVPEGRWIACVHVRESGFSPNDEAFHSHRNGDILTLIPVVREIYRRGGWCVRMGDPSMSRLESIEGLVDYAHHALKSDRMDVILCARARVFIGDSSGLSFVSTAFGVPCARANMIPLSALALAKTDLSIPKLLMRETNKRMLCFAEIMSAPIGDYLYADLYRKAGVSIVNNTKEEILDLVVEMLNRLEGTHVEFPEDEELQQRFMKLFRPGHYAYGAASRVGAAFLRKYRYLLD